MSLRTGVNGCCERVKAPSERMRTGERASACTRETNTHRAHVTFSALHVYPFTRSHPFATASYPFALAFTPVRIARTCFSHLPPKKKEMSDSKTTWLRRELPTIAGVVDNFADAFGRENIRVTYASENGHELGARALQAPENTFRLSDTVIGPINATQRDSASRKGK